MGYETNTVYFTPSTDGVGNFAAISYTVTALSISPNEDPDHKNNVGDFKNFNISSVGTQISFEVGRHGTGDVATFWNQNITSNQSTFNHGAGVLNFAFLGTLVCSAVDSKGTSYTATFKNVGLAQGHSGSTNNWWFGGQTCTNVGSDTVKCYGTDQNGKALWYEFVRGDATEVDEVRWAGWDWVSSDEL